jgi:arylsulfatase A-like enzyme
MNKNIAGLAVLFSVVTAVAMPAVGRPNVVLIYADDLGFGDLSCYNPDGKISTPNIDKLAQNGMRFVDAHAPDTICSPSRYGILTGRYSWRTHIKSGNPVPGDQPWIEKSRLTLPAMLKGLGYDTAVFGKWGLGADWSAAAKPGREGIDISADAIDYSKPIYSARSAGFTYEEVHLWYGSEYFKKQYTTSADASAPRYTDGGRWYFENGLSRGGDPDFAAFDMEAAQMHYIRRSVDYIDAKGGASRQHGFAIQEDAPFFLYYAPHIPHSPIVPAPQFQGKTDAGFFGDFVAELDWAVGQIVGALERNGLLSNTLIIFSSDNGAERYAYKRMQQYEHFSNGDWRGVKRDLWEGGHRVPFVISWPGKVQGGLVSDRLVSQTDIFSTLAQYFEVSLPDNAAEDSYSFLDELMDTKVSMPKRDFAVHHSMDNQYAIRKGDWVFVQSPSGDTNGQQGEPQWLRDERAILSHTQPYELFNLAEDPQQKVNLYSTYSEKAGELARLLEKIMENGRTRDR